MSISLTLPPINDSAFISDTVSAKIVAFLYGSPERTWMTMTVAFALLALGISMMQQGAGTGGACML
jgi:hypothetical protein